MAPGTLNPLSPARIIERMAEALPTHDKDDTTSDLSSSLDVVALCIHASMTSLDFKLISLNEDDKTCMLSSLPLPTPDHWLTSPLQVPTAQARPRACHQPGTPVSTLETSSTPTRSRQ